MSNATHCIPWNADCSICNPPRGQTHYEGCERAPGHHGCAVDALDRARQALQEIDDLLLVPQSLSGAYLIERLDEILFRYRAAARAQP